MEEGNKNKLNSTKIKFEKILDEVSEKRKVPVVNYLITTNPGVTLMKITEDELPYGDQKWT